MLFIPSFTLHCTIITRASRYHLVQYLSYPGLKVYQFRSYYPGIGYTLPLQIYKRIIVDLLLLFLLSVELGRGVQLTGVSDHKIKNSSSCAKEEKRQLNIIHYNWRKHGKKYQIAETTKLQRPHLPNQRLYQIENSMQN